jgi:hypothetical protein
MTFGTSQMKLAVPQASSSVRFKLEKQANMTLI